MSELPAEITSYKGRLCEKHSDFIWGDYIDDSIVEGLYHFWHKQDIIAFHDGMVFNDGDTYVDKDFKDSVDLHIPVSLAIKPIQDYTHALQGVLNKYTERFPFSELSRFLIVEPMSMQWYPLAVDSSSGIQREQTLYQVMSIDIWSS